MTIKHLFKIEGKHKKKVLVHGKTKTFYREQMVGRKEIEDKKFIMERGDFYLDSVKIDEDTAYKYVQEKVINDLTNKKMNDKKLREYAKDHNFYAGWVDTAYRKIKEPRSIKSIEKDIERVEDQYINRIKSSRAQGGSRPGGGAMDRDLQRIHEKSQNLKDELKRANEYNKKVKSLFNK